MKYKTLVLLASLWFFIIPAQAHWGGLYFGINEDYTWNKTRYHFLEKAVGDFPYLFAPYLKGGHFDKNGNGGSFGAQLGVNRQCGYLVFGLEGSFDKCWHKNRASNVFLFAANPQPFTTYQTRTCWFASITPRLGFAYNNVLFYVKAGLGLSKVRSHLKQSDITAIPQVHSFTQTQDQAGWVLGYGLEYLWCCHWIVGLECDLFKEAKRHYGGVVVPDTTWPLEYTLERQNCLVIFRLSYKM